MLAYLAIARQELAKVDDSVPAVTRAVEKLQRIIHTDKGKEALGKLLDARAAFKAREHALIELVKAQRIEEGRVLFFIPIVVFALPLTAFSNEGIGRAFRWRPRTLSSAAWTASPRSTRSVRSKPPHAT